MLFEYFKDKIILNNELINNYENIPILDDFIRKVKDCLLEMGIKKQDVSFFYKRNKDGASVIGVQLEDGDNEDISNYVVYDILVKHVNSNIFFEPEIHAKANILDKALVFDKLAKKDIYIFFTEMENQIIKNNKEDIEFDIMKEIHIQKKSKLLQILKKD